MIAHSYYSNSSGKEGYEVYGYLPIFSLFCATVKPIGGYFELELATGFSEYHDKAYSYTSARAAFKACINFLKPAKIYVPYYCCDSLLLPLKETGTTYTLYGINNDFQPVSLPDLHENEYFLYINFFGINGSVIKELYIRYGSQLMVDATQAFFDIPAENYWHFNSCRKFFGVPDGSYIYAAKSGFASGKVYNTRYSTEHLLKRKLGKAEEGYDLFLLNESLITTEPLEMSLLSKVLLTSINYEDAKKVRRLNFITCHEQLRDSNRLQLEPHDGEVPFCYPYLPEKKIDRQVLISNKIFIPTLWPEVAAKESEEMAFENDLASMMLPLPVDQRYGAPDMEFVVKKITEQLR